MYVRVLCSLCKRTPRAPPAAGSCALAAETALATRTGARLDVLSALAVEEEVASIERAGAPPEAPVVDAALPVLEIETVLGAEGDASSAPSSCSSDSET